MAFKNKEEKAAYYKRVYEKNKESILVQHKQRREKHIAAGMCTIHPSRPVALGHTLCQECLDYNKQRHKKHKAAGMCPGHPSRPAVLGHTTCQECIDYQKRLREKRRRAGMCVHCGERLAVLEHVVCQECLDAHKARNAIAKKDDLAGVYALYYPRLIQFKIGHGLSIESRLTEARTHVGKEGAFLVAYTEIKDKLSRFDAENKIKQALNLNGTEIISDTPEVREYISKAFDAVNFDGMLFF